MKRLAALLLSLLLLLPSALAGADPMVRAGGAFCLALDAQGQLWGWGDTSRGQLGIGRGNKIYRPVPALLGLDGSQIREIACGNVNTLILMQDGTVWTCGGNDYGQQGLGDRKAHVKEPEPIPSLQHIVQIACGWGQCLALTEDGQVYAWGRNSNGQLGTGERRSENVPTLLSLTGITHIHCGGKYCLAMDAQGQIWGWGDNEYGTLPGCPRHNQYSPVLLSISGQFTALATAGETAFGLDAEGQLWGWGRNDLYQVGNDTPGKIADTPLPVLLPEGTAIRRVLAYNAHTAVLTENGQLWVWGSLSHGQGNTGRRMTKSLPLDATPEAPLLDADVGSLQMVALDTSGTVWGIGGGEYGQTGNGRQNAYYVTQWVDTGLHLLEASSISILTEGGPIP